MSEYNQWAREGQFEINYNPNKIMKEYNNGTQSST